MSRSQTPSIVVSIHDVAPPFAREIIEAVSLFEGLGVGKFSLLAVPEFHGTPLDSDPKFIEWLRGRATRGDEIVLHGLRHMQTHRPKGLIRTLKNSLLTRGEGEFLGIPAITAGNLLDQGLNILRTLGFSPLGFVAPAWLMEKSIIEELKKRGFLYSTLRTRINDLRNGDFIRSPALVLRGSSRNMSRLSRAYNNLLLGPAAMREVVRLAVHPADIRFRADAWFRTILSGALKGRRSITYLDLIKERLSAAV
jgi:predicted deacetylase